MRAAALLLVALLALPASAQDELRDERVVLEVESATVRTLEGHTYAVKGGGYLSQASWLASARELAALRAENQALRNAPSVTPMAIVVASSIAVVVGFGLGFVATRHIQ